MLEAALLIILAGGGLWMLARRLRQRPTPADGEDTDRRLLTPIAHGGLYRVGSPDDMPPFSAFSDLHLVQGGLALRDNRSGQMCQFDFAFVQWVSAVTLAFATHAPATKASASGALNPNFMCLLRYANPVNCLP